VVLKKHFDGWKSRKKQKTDKKAAPKASAAVSAPEANRPAASTSRAQVCPPHYLFFRKRHATVVGF
jgi:hypothetical protein